MLLFKCEIKEDVSKKLSARALNRAGRAAFEQVGAVWHADMLPDHFDASKQRKYNYQPRSSKYRRRKLQLAARGIVKKAGLADLVFTGALENLLEDFRQIRAYPTRLSVKMTGPGYLTTRFREGSKQPDKRKEILTVRPSEEKQLAHVFRDAYLAELELEKTKRSAAPRGGRPRKS